MLAGLPCAAPENLFQHGCSGCSSVDWKRTKPGKYVIVLYDNVPGGAVPIEQRKHESVLGNMIGSTRKRVQGRCGCDSSCYGCLRSYCNQFAYPHLDRRRALEVLTPQDRAKGESGVL